MLHYLDFSKIVRKFAPQQKDKRMKEKKYPVIEDSGIGPYTMEELNARIDEAEVFIEKAERGDWSDWVTNEEMDAELYREYPWLR